MFTLKDTTTLLPHQARYVELQLEKKAFGCFDRPGTGKTLEILASACAIGKKTLVIAPPHLCNNWLSEIEKFTHLEPRKDIEICPYTMVEKRVHDLSEYGYVALDEAHYIKNLTAKRTIAIHALLQDYTPEFYTYATGTPITNRIPEIYSFLVSMAYHSHVKPNILDRYPTHYQFCQRFCNVTESRFGGRSVMQYSGVKNLDELRTYLRPWTICRDYSQVEGMETQVIRANYKDDPELDKAWQAFAVAREINPTAKRDSAVAKAHFTAEYCKNELLSGNVPLVVFSDHPDAVFAIERELGADYRVKSIVGGIPMGERHATVEAFQRGLLDAIVLSTGSSSTGITLTRASTVVFNDIPWTPEDLHQARKRVDRIGQTKRTRCVYVVGSKVDDHIVKTVEGKSKVIKQLAKEYGDGETTGDEHLLA